MPPKIRELKAALRQAGFSERPGKGSHTVWYDPVTHERLVLAGNDGDDAKRYQERAVREAVEKARRSQEEES